MRTSGSSAAASAPHPGLRTPTGLRFTGVPVRPPAWALGPTGVHRISMATAGRWSGPRSSVTVCSRASASVELRRSSRPGAVSSSVRRMAGRSGCSVCSYPAVAVCLMGRATRTARDRIAVPLSEERSRMVTFDGLPLHPLIVHAPVVLIPLVAAGLVVLLVRPSLRPTLAPIVAVLAVGAAVTAWGAVWSGEELGEALGRGDELESHESWGELARTFAVIVALGVVAFAATDRFLPQRPTITRVLGVVTTGVAIAAVGVVGVAGHAGATLAWEGKVPAGGAVDIEEAGDADSEGDDDPAVAGDGATEDGGEP